MNLFKKILSILLLNILFTPTSWGAYSFVRSLTGSANASSPTAVSATVPAAGCALGNMVIIGVVVADSATPPTISDTQGNTWTQLGTAAVNTGTRTSHSYIYYSVLTHALVSGNLVTATISVLRMSIVGMEFSGVTGSTISDQTNNGNGTGLAVSAGAITTTSSDLVVAYMAGLHINTAFTIAPGIGWTGGTDAGAGVGAPGSYIDSVLEYRIEPSPGTFTGDGTVSGATNADWGAVIGSFKEPSAAADTSGFFLLF